MFVSVSRCMSEKIKIQIDEKRMENGRVEHCLHAVVET